MYCIEKKTQRIFLYVKMESEKDIQKIVSQLFCTPKNVLLLKKGRSLNDPSILTVPVNNTNYSAYLKEDTYILFIKNGVDDTELAFIDEEGFYEQFVRRSKLNLYKVRGLIENMEAIAQATIGNKEIQYDLPIEIGQERTDTFFKSLEKLSIDLKEVYERLGNGKTTPVSEVSDNKEP